MTDLVERLNWHAKVRGPLQNNHTPLKQLYGEAADEIERLRAALKFYADEWDEGARKGPTFPTPTLYRDRGNKARSALSGQS